MELFPPAPTTVQDVPAPIITPGHSPHPSHGSAGFRTPINILTLHEYRKQQHTPSPNSTASTGRTLRRKPAALRLHSLERIPSRPSSSSSEFSPIDDPVLTPPNSRPSITLARDLSSIFDQYAALGVDTRLTREDLLSLSSLRASSDSAPSLKSSFSFSYLDRRTSSAPTHDDIESVYRAYDTPRRPSTAFKPIKKLPHPRGVRKVSSNGSFVAFSNSFRHRPPNSTPLLDNSSTSNISLSKFPQPPFPVTSIITRPDDNAPRLRPSVSTATITPPATPTVFHYRGASFDLLNPHRSLDLHAIETPEPDRDLADYPFPPFSDNPVEMGDGDGQNRRIFQTLPSAHKAITKKPKFVRLKDGHIDEGYNNANQELNVPQHPFPSEYAPEHASPSNCGEGPLRHAIDSIFPYIADATDSAKNSPHSTHNLTPTNFGFPHGQGFSFTAERYPSSVYSRDDELPRPISKRGEDAREAKSDGALQGLELPEHAVPRSATSPGRISGNAREGLSRSGSATGSKRNVLLKRNHLDFDMVAPPIPARDPARLVSDSSSSDDVRRVEVQAGGITPVSGSDTNASSYEATTKLLELTPKVKKWSRRKRDSLKISHRTHRSPIVPEASASDVEIPADPRPSESSDWKTVDEPVELIDMAPSPPSPPSPPYARTWRITNPDVVTDDDSVTHSHRPNESSLANLSSRYDSTDNLIAQPKKGHSRPPVSRAYNRTSGSSIANVSSTGDSADFGQPAATPAQLFPEPSETPFGLASALPGATDPRFDGEDGYTSPKSSYVQALRASLLPPELKGVSSFSKDIEMSPLSPISDHSPTTPDQNIIVYERDSVPQDARYVPYVPGAISPDPYRPRSQEEYELDVLQGYGPGPSLVDQTFYDIPLDDAPTNSRSQARQSTKDLEAQVARPAPAFFKMPLFKQPLSAQRYPLKPNHVTFQAKSPEQISAAEPSPTTTNTPEALPRLFDKHHRQQIFATRANIDRGNYPLTPDEQLEAILALRRAQLEFPEERQAMRLVVLFCMVTALIPPLFLLLVATGCVSTFLSWFTDGKVTKVPPKARRVLTWVGAGEVVVSVGLAIGLGVYFGVVKK